VATSYLLAFVALYASEMLTLAVALVGCTNLVSAPILSMGLLGEEAVDVFEVRECSIWMCLASTV
jgi:hypothetical protein